MIVAPVRATTTTTTTATDATWTAARSVRVVVNYSSVERAAAATIVPALRAIAILAKPGTAAAARTSTVIIPVVISVVAIP
jgi:hypothetical protein